MLVFFVKLLLSMLLIIFCTQVGRRFPSLGGLIATMPLTSLIILLWLYSDNPGDYDLMMKYTKAALWGILPSITFFLVAYLCFSKHLPILHVVSIAFGTWLLGAFIHHRLLG